MNHGGMRNSMVKFQITVCFHNARSFYRVISTCDRSYLIKLFPERAFIWLRVIWRACDISFTLSSHLFKIKLVYALSFYFVYSSLSTFISTDGKQRLLIFIVNIDRGSNKNNQCNISYLFFRCYWRISHCVNMRSISSSHYIKIRMRFYLKRFFVPAFFHAFYKIYY